MDSYTARLGYTYDVYAYGSHQFFHFDSELLVTDYQEDVD
jgi:hypothetical protein